MKRLTALAFAVLAMVVLGACYDPEGLRDERFEAQREVFEGRVTDGGSGEPSATPDPDATVDPDDPASALIQGLRVPDYYASLCISCHGAQREGGVGLPLTPEALTESDEFYIETIKNGREGTLMAPYGGGAVLTDDEVEAMVTWLKNSQP